MSLRMPFGEVPTGKNILPRSVPSSRYPWKIIPTRIAAKMVTMPRPVDVPMMIFLLVFSSISGGGIGAALLLLGVDDVGGGLFGGIEILELVDFFVVLGSLVGG